MAVHWDGNRIVTEQQTGSSITNAYQGLTGQGLMGIGGNNIYHGVNALGGFVTPTQQLPIGYHHDGCMTQDDLTAEERMCVLDWIIGEVEDKPHMITFRNGTATWENVMLRLVHSTITLCAPVALHQPFVAGDADATMAAKAKKLWDLLHQARHDYGNHTTVKALEKIGVSFESIRQTKTRRAVERMKDDIAELVS